MSLSLINLSPDLTKLKNDGYEIDIKSGHLIINNVPYVNSKREVKRGILISTLNLAGDITTVPDTHVAMFSGEYPCDKNGRKLTKIECESLNQTIDNGIVACYSFSSKPSEGYQDYHHKMTTYANIISSHAEAINPNATAKTLQVIEPHGPKSVFNYIDNASSHAGISEVSRKLELEKVAIVGLGGTGSYILDLVSKTPVREIQLFDSDYFLQHNAFRSPGAASLDELKNTHKKVHYFKERYSFMHRNIIANDFHIEADNVMCLQEMDFVFLCMDRSDMKQPIVEKLEEFDIPFIDVGMGLELVDKQLQGIVRVTTSTTDKRDHVKKRISFSDNVVDAVYVQNIQTADLNALNAVLAVIKWKKLFGFYRDLEQEHFSAYTLDGNSIVNEDKNPL